MKTFFNQIFDKALHLSSPKKVNPYSDWLHGLADMDDLKAITFSTKQLTLISASDSNDTQQLLDLMIELEEIHFDRLDKLAYQFANTENMKPDLENSISDACYNYCRQSYICHLKVIEKVINPNKFKLANDMPLQIMTRAIYAAINMLKWRLFAQAAPPTKMWLQIYMLYRIANQQALLNIPTLLFKQTPSTTLGAYIMQLCMLGQLVQENLQKIQVDIAARLMAEWLTRGHISKQLTPEQYLFYIDCEKDVPAKRMRNFAPNEHCRYWELDEFEKQVAVAINTSDRGEIPQNLSGAQINNAKKLHQTLSILQAEWRKKGYVRQRRKEPRQAASKAAKVNAGVVNICNQVLQANQISSGLKLTRDGKSFDERLLGHTVLRESNAIPTGNLAVNSSSLDTWIVTDESPHGLGTRVNKYANILARPDKLIALMMDEDPSEVVIGIIRGVKPTSGNQLKVGVQVLSRHPTWVQMRQIGREESFSDTLSETSPFNKSNSNVDFGVFAGIYCPIEAGLGEVSTLILPKLNYRSNTNYAVSIAGSPKRAMLGEPLESRDDWVKVVFPF